VGQLPLPRDDQRAPAIAPGMYFFFGFGFWFDHFIDTGRTEEEEKSTQQS
jgi:hypothetical protein